MILSMSNQFILFLMSTALGFISGFIYDLFRVFRRIIKHNKFFVQLEDFIYWIILALIIFFIILQKNSGEIRAFLFLGFFIGMILYFTTLSRLFLKFSKKLIDFIKQILKVVFLPVFSVYLFFKKIFLYFKQMLTKLFTHKKT